MILRIFVTIFFFGFAILLGILGVVRGLYWSSVFQSPDIPGDSDAEASLDGRERLQAYPHRR
jgi:hypothetical protein